MNDLGKRADAHLVRKLPRQNGFVGHGPAANENLRH